MNKYKPTAEQIRQFRSNEADRLIIDDLNIDHAIEYARVFTNTQTYTISANIFTHIAEMWNKSSRNNTVMVELRSRSLCFGAIGEFRIESHGVWVEDGVAQCSIDLESVCSPFVIPIVDDSKSTLTNT